MDTRLLDAGEFGDDLLWYKDAIIYELHVRAFMDSNGDGIGDFNGLIEKLDYIQDLGVTAIWLLPFYPSPLRDDGYDIADYNEVNPSYGVMEDVRRFIAEAHTRGLRVINELVCNHTSDQHAWFQRARRAARGTPERDFYVWSDDDEKYSGVRIIFTDTETSNWTFDRQAGQYYWHRFFHHQPDLNFDNPEVHEAIFAAMDAWFEMGIDGTRLDAIPYLYEREGTNGENLPETHAFLKELRARLDANYPGRMFLAEANQWPEDSIAYFGDGDECHMAFHFPVMPRLYMAIMMEDRYPIVDIMEQTPELPDGCQWAMFLRNHDELTLEMVTDEERDYMYRTYAGDIQARINVGIRRRLAPLLSNNRRRIELMNSLLFTMPGTPVLYYGDEIGMGDNIYLGDRNSVRTPMQWSADRNAGFSTANSQRLFLPVITDSEYHYQTINVEAQQHNPQSLLWWTKRLIALRKRFRAFGRGTIRFLDPDNHKVLAYLREYEDERILIVANLSRYSQTVDLDLTEFRGTTPVELFGRTEFPVIGEQPYFLSLGPHSFYWFSLAQTVEPDHVVPRLATTGNWQRALTGRQAQTLAAVLPAYLRGQRWFAGKARKVTTVEITEAAELPAAEHSLCLMTLRVQYTEGLPEIYMLPLSWVTDDDMRRIEEETPHAVVARLHADGRDGALVDALYLPSCRAALYAVICAGEQLRGRAGTFAGQPTTAFRELAGAGGLPPESRLMSAEQSNSSIVYDEQLIFKVFRKVEPGVNPDLEIGRFLTERTTFPQMAGVAGSLEYRAERGEPTTLGILQAFVPGADDAWSYTLDSLDRYFEVVLAAEHRLEELTLPEQSLSAPAGDEAPGLARELIGAYLDDAGLLGQRTAELHLALASDPTNPDFAPRELTELDQRSLYQSLRTQTGRVVNTLRRTLPRLPLEVRSDAERVLAYHGEIDGRFRQLTRKPLKAKRIRTHGDYHLGQVLYSQRDFVIIDFEGEPARPLSERRLKRSPLRDVAGMLRSFDYAAHAKLHDIGRGTAVRAEDLPVAEQWAEFWRAWVSDAFLQAYLETIRPGALLPPDPDNLELLLNAFLLDKAVYELGYELSHRPDWLSIPARGIVQLLERTR